MNIRLVRFTIEQLGFPEGALTREIIGTENDHDILGNVAPFCGGKRAELGLELCPAEVGPQLRLQYSDQPSGERLYVAMMPIIASDGEPRIFVLLNDVSGMSLDAARARADDKWAASDAFIFSGGMRVDGDSVRIDD